MVELGRILATSITSTARAILANIGSLGNDDTDEQGDVANDQPMFTAPGLYCRPLGRVKEEDATGLNPAGVCEVVFIRSADEAYPVGFRDDRLSRVPNPIPGEVGLAQYQGGFISLRPNADGDGTNFMLYGARKDSSGEVVSASSISIETASATPQILMQHELGQTLVLNKDGGVVLANAANDAYVEVKPVGVTINGAEVVITGGVVMGNSDPAATQFVALHNLVEQIVGQLAGAILNATPTSGDGGAAIQTAAKATLSGLGWTDGGTVPPTQSTAATLVKGV